MEGAVSRHAHNVQIAVCPLQRSAVLVDYNEVVIGKAQLLGQSIAYFAVSDNNDFHIMCLAFLPLAGAVSSCRIFCGFRS